MSTLPRASLAPANPVYRDLRKRRGPEQPAADKLAIGRLLPRLLEVRLTERQVGEHQYPHAISAATMLPHNSLAFSA